MFETDREMYLAFAKAVDMDFQWITELLDGEVDAGGPAALTLAAKTNTTPNRWASSKGRDSRLLAVKVWWAMPEQRKSRLAQRSGVRD